MKPSPRTLSVVLVVVASVAGGVAWMRSRAPSAADASVDDAPTRVRRSRARPRDEAPFPVDEGPIDPRVANVARDPFRAVLREPIFLAGPVEEASGSPPEREGSPCRLGVDRTDDATACRVVLTCGTTRLLGAPLIHDTRCAFDGDVLTSLVDDATTAGDRDPSLTYDATEGTLVVEDDRFGVYRDYRIVARLSPTSAAGASP